jgi:PAS domain S-box-containing protein
MDPLTPPIEAPASAVALVTAGAAPDLEALRRSLAAKDRELDLLTRRASVLQVLAADLTRAESPEEVARAVTAHGTALFGATGCLLFLVSDDGATLDLVSFDGVEAPRVEAYRRVPVASRIPLADSFRTGQPVWVDSREALLERYPDLGGVRRGDLPLQGFVTVPVRGMGQVLGGLALSYYETPLLSDVQRDFILTVGAQCGVAIERARARQIERRALAAERQANERLAREQQRLAVLAQASDALASYADPRQAMARLAKLVVPALADWCAIEELGPDGKLRPVIVEHRDPDRVALARRLREKYPPRPEEPRGVAGTLRTGEPDFMARIPDELLQRGARDPEHLALLRELRFTSYATVPIKVEGRVVAVLSLVAEGERQLAHEDLRFAVELARRASAALVHARQEVRLRGLVEATAAIVWTATARGEVVEPSPSWMAFTGQSEDEYRDGGFLDAIHPDDRAATMATWRKAVDAAAPYAAEYRLRRVDGTYAHTLARGRPVRGATGEVLEYVGCNVDVTELRQAERLAHDQAGTLATINELGRLIAAELDTQKIVQAVTDAATALTGAQFGAFFYNVEDPRGGRYMLYTLSGVPREHFEKFPMPRNTAVFAPTFEGTGVVRSDDITADPRYGKNAPRRGMPEGHLPVRSYLAVPVTSRTGQVIGGIFLGHGRPGVFDDRAEALALGLAAQAAVAMDNARLFDDAQRLIKDLETTNRELDQFAYVASHDLRAPLRGISSLAEWLEEDVGTSLPEDGRKTLALLRGRVRRMENLIQGILDYSRAARGAERGEAVDLGALVVEVKDLLAPTPPATIVAGDALPVVTGDRVALQQVLMNLVGNALKHAGRPDVLVQVAARRTDTGWELRVADNGPGIPAEYHDRVWGIFQTLQPRDRMETTGIGLAIVKKIVERRGGQVWIEASPGGGATFGFTWPETAPRRD